MAGSRNVGVTERQPLFICQKFLSNVFIVEGSSTIDDGLDFCISGSSRLYFPACLQSIYNPFGLLIVMFIQASLFVDV